MDPEQEGLQPEREHPRQEPEREQPRMQGPQSEPVRPESPQPAPARSPLEPQPIVRKVRPNWILGLLAIVLLAGAAFLYSGRDVKPPYQPQNYPAGQQETVSDEIVVNFVDTATDQEIAQLGNLLGVTFRPSNSVLAPKKILVGKVDAANRQAILEALRKDKLVEAADPQIVFRAYAKPNDPMYGQQWHLHMIRVEEAWRYTKGKGAVVAVVDTGVGMPDPKRWDKTTDLASTRFTLPKDFSDGDAIPNDQSGHGTHIASTIAESTGNNLMGAGVAPEATIMPVRVLGGGSRGTLDQIAAGILYAAQNGADVINLSLGAYQQSAIMEQAVKEAAQLGAVLVCAAGNDRVAYGGIPADYPECITVSAVNQKGEFASYSNYGDRIDIAAPGGDDAQGPSSGIWHNTIRPVQVGPRQVVLKEGFYSLVGTSMATPQVAGVAALLVSMGIRDRDEIRSLLRKSATARGDARYYGAGIVDAAEALKATGRSPYQRFFSWIALGMVGGLLYLTTPPVERVSLLITLVIGYFLPVGLERVTKFGSWWNLVGHSMALPLVWAITPAMPPVALRQVMAFTLGFMAHFAVDIFTKASPFQVLPQSRISLWLFLNLAIGAYIVASSLIKARPPKGSKKKRHSQKRQPAYA